MTRGSSVGGYIEVERLKLDNDGHRAIRDTARIQYEIEVMYPFWAISTAVRMPGYFKSRA